MREPHHKQLFGLCPVPPLLLVEMVVSLSRVAVMKPITDPGALVPKGGGYAYSDWRCDEAGV